MPKLIKLLDIPIDYPAKEAVEVAFGPLAGAVIYKQIVERVGREPGNELGHGDMGVVYSLGHGRALKLTADASELKAMTLMKGSRHPNLIRVEDVFVVCRGQSGIGVVVREWVGNVLDNIDGMSEFNNGIRSAMNNTEDAIDNYVEKLSSVESSRRGMEDLLAYLEGIGDDDEIGSKLEQDIRNGIDALFRLGIYGIDFAPRNIAVDDGGNAVIFDVGVVETGKPVVVDRIGCPAGRRIVSPD